MDYYKLSRRDFLKTTGKAALAGAAALSFGSLTGCASFPKETREEVAQIKWDCNPILPMPKNGGIYIGTNIQVWGMGEDWVAAQFEKRYGKWPTFLAPGMGRVGAYDKYFPKSSVDEAHRAGAIPMIRYILNPKSGNWRKVGASKGYSEINRGLRDDDIKIFGAEAAKLEKPIIVCPFQQPNDTQSIWRGWAGPGTSEPFKETYVRIHEIWKQEGALEKVLMGVKLKVGRWRDWQFPDPLRYIPPKETVDNIGWCANNHCQPHRYTPSRSFEAILKIDYSRVVDKYPNIPQFIWELACHEPCNQAAWYDDALTKIEESYHWIKAVNLDENADSVGDFAVDPVPNEESTQVIRKHFANPRYIGNILPQKDF